MTDGKGQTVEKRRRRPLLPTSYSLLPAHLDPGLLLAGLLALFVIHPLLQPGLPGSADTPIHFYRTLEFARSWVPGVVYPRWAPDLAYGYGHPLWDFAPPLPYLIPLALHTVGLSLEASLKGLVILTALGYALGAYLFVRNSLGPKAGLVGAAIYTLAPFALRETLLYGGNYPQYLAIGLYPWVLWSLGRVKRRGGWLNVVLVAIFYGGVILSHLFHALILTPVAAAYALALWLSDRRDVRRLGASVLALGLGLLGTAFFWLPALVERTFTHSTEDVYLHVSPFYLRFLSWRELLAWPQALDARSADPWVPFSLGLTTLLLAALGLLVVLLGARGCPSWLRHAGREGLKSPGWCLSLTPPGPRGDPSWSAGREVGMGSPQPSAPTRVQALFFLSLLAVCIFMVLPVSDWVWTNAPFLAVAEFPWRLLGLANLSLAFLGGASVYVLSSRTRTTLALASVLAVLLTSAVYLYPFRPFVRYGETIADMASYELASRTIGTTTLGEYLPRWVETTPATSPLAEALSRGEPVEKLDRSSLPEGATTQLLDHTAISDGYHIDSPQPFRARFLTHYFPGWRVQIDGQPAEIVIEPESGLITVPVPAGAHELHLQFGDTPLRTAANIITASTLAALALAGLRKIAPGVRPAHSPPQPARRPVLDCASGPGSQHEQPLTSSPQPIAPRWRLRPALLVGGSLIGLLLIKGFVVDPHTEWFRHASSSDQVSGVQHPMRVNLDDQFWLLGYDLDRDRVAQGDTLRVVLYWQALRPVDTDYRSFVHLDAPTDQRTWAGSDNYQPGDATAQIDIPTSTWDTAHYVRDEHFIRVPPNVPPVRFSLRAGLYDPDTGQRLPLASAEGNTITLRPVQVTPGQGLRQADVPNRVNYRLGDHIRLLGYDWDPAGATLTLYWQTDQPLADDYVVFVHLLDKRGKLAWGADTPPLGGLYPTSDWQPGVIVADPRPLAPDTLPPGSYTLAVGMYPPDTLARLPVVDADGQPVAGGAIRLTRLDWP
jgi:hypothetical protein